MQITPYDPSLREAVLAFAEEYGLVWGTDRDLFLWKYERPLPAACPSGIPRLWVVRDGDRVAATFGNQPLRFVYRGTEWTGGVAVDAHVRADLRGQGIGKKFLALFAEACPLRLMLHSTPVAHNLYLKLGYAAIPNMEVLTRMVPSPRTAWRAVRWALGRERAGGRPQPLPPAAPRMAACLQDCRREPGEDREGLDRFIAQSRRRYEFAVVRDWEFLLWRYREHPHGGGELFSIRDARGRLRALFGLAWKRMHGMDALTLTDLFAGDEDGAVAAGVIASLPRMARVVGADLVSFAGMPSDLRALVARYPRRRSRLCSVWLPREAIEPPPHYDRWYVTGADSDYIG